MTGTMAEQASRPSSAETKQQETLHEALPIHHASGLDQKPRAGADGTREHTSQLSPAERTRSPRRSGECSAPGTEQSWTINLGQGPRESKTGKDATPGPYHDPDALGPPAPATPFGGPDLALTPTEMFTQAGWSTDKRHTG